MREQHTTNIQLMEAFIHGFRATVKSVNVPELVNFIISSTKESVEWRSESPTRSGRVWGGSAKGTVGSVFWFDSLEEKSDFGLSVSGKACERMGLRNTWRLITGLSNWYGCKFTRIDCKVRVPSELVSPRQLFDIGKFGNFSGCVNRPEWKESPSKVSIGGQEFNGYAGTCYYGSRQSEAFMRVYDPYHNHGVADATDIEIEYKKGKAITVSQKLCAIPQGSADEEIGHLVATLAVSHFDFIDRSKGDKNLDRCPRLSLWQRVLDFVGTAKQKIQSTVVEPSLEKFKKYMERAVIGGLEALCQVYGNSSVYAWMQTKRLEKRENMPARWTALVNEATGCSSLRDGVLPEVEELLHPCSLQNKNDIDYTWFSELNVSMEPLVDIIELNIVEKIGRSEICR